MRETIRINPPTRDNSAPLAKLGLHRAKASFQETLEGAQRVRFSRHASQRMATREIELDNDKLHELERAIDRAKDRGGKASLVLMDGTAFIVDVQDRTVITAMDAKRRDGAVFTQIDSVVLVHERSVRERGPLGGMRI